MTVFHCASSGTVSTIAAVHDGSDPPEIDILAIIAHEPHFVKAFMHAGSGIRDMKIPRKFSEKFFRFLKLLPSPGRLYD